MTRILLVLAVAAAVLVFAFGVPVGQVHAGGIEITDGQKMPVVEPPVDEPVEEPAVEEMPKMPELIEPYEEPVKDDGQRLWVLVVIGFVAGMFLLAL